MKRARGPRLTWVSSLLVISWLHIGCGASLPAADEAAAAQDLAARPTWLDAGERDGVARRLVDLAERMRPHGIEPSGIEGRGFMSRGERNTHRFDLPPSRCLTIIAMASRGLRDLDVHLFTPEGDEVARDVEPDAHPTVQVCGGDGPRTLYYVIDAYDGAGGYRFATFIGNQSTLEAAANLVGGRPGVAQLGAEASDPDSLLRSISQSVNTRGFRPHGEPIPVPLEADQRIRIPLHAERGQCYTAAALPGPGISDLDLRIFDEAGEQVAADVSARAAPVAQLCAGRETELAIEVHATRGSGQARLAVFKADSSTVGGEGGLWLGEPGDALLSRLPLEQAVERQVAEAEQLGWSGSRRRAESQLVPGEAQAHSLNLPAGQCTLVLVSGGTGTGGLKLTITDPRGRLLAERKERGSVSARLCPERPLVAEVLIEGDRGASPYAMHTLTRPVPETLPADATAEDRGALLDVIEDASRKAFTMEPFRTVTMPTQVALEERGCVIVRMVAQGAEGRVEARATRGDQILDHDFGRTARIQVCNRENVRGAALELRGRGRVFVSLLRPSEP